MVAFASSPVVPGAKARRNHHLTEPQPLSATKVDVGVRFNIRVLIFS